TALGLLLSLGCAVHASNDDLIDALLLDLNGRVQIDTSGFSRQPNEPGTGNQNNRTAWFVWTAPIGGPATVRFSTYGSRYAPPTNFWERDPKQPNPRGGP